ncbi:MAG: hypothetical protein Q7K20_03340 [Polaromonas sp.]|nr:hypothetical protein [Polaromonas sp.]
MARHQHSAQFRAEVLQACRQADASVAAIALVLAPIEVGQMALGQPVLDGDGQEFLLFRVVRDVVV